MDLICKLLEDRGLGAQAWLVGWVGLLQAWTWARALGPWKWTLPEGSSCHGPAAGPLLTRLRPSVAEHYVLRASQQLRIPVIVSLLSQQKLGLTHSTRVSSECPRSSGSRRGRKLHCNQVGRGGKLLFCVSDVGEMAAAI